VTDWTTWRSIQLRLDVGGDAVNGMDLMSEDDYPRASLDWRRISMAVSGVWLPG
jgi:hypothetical protein